jgi:MSHA biogenesis protein MshE
MLSKLKEKIRIGDILVAKQIITNEQLTHALSEQKKSGMRLGKTLIALKYVDEKSLLSILSEQLNIPFIDLKNYNYTHNDVRSLKETVARRYRVIVLKQSPNSLTLGMSDPTDIFCLDEIASIFRKTIEPVIVKESDLLDVLDNSYGETEKIASLAEELNEELEEDVVDVDVDHLADDVDESSAPVVRLIQKIFEEAVRYKASDIHIEPDEKVLRIRLRIDGVLTEQVMNEKRIASALVVRLKLISGLDISEKRLPQDGRFNVRVHKKSVDVRISTMPVQHGESVVMRLLVLEEGVRSLDEIGIDPKLKNHFRSMIKQPHGLILVTGPTGSGKTSTLYAALSELNTPDKKIITVEDPVEYRLPRLNQVQIKDKIGLDFNTVLRSTLRQDPDILLIGEIRDAHSAEIALRAAMTGHLVLSTLHTNDAISSALRLIDMGVDEFLVASSLKAVVAQRLVRRLCHHCKTPVTDISPWEHLLPEGENKNKQTTYYQSVGCTHCFNTGFRGRVGIFEYLPINYEMADALRVKDIAQFSALSKASKIFRPLKDSALDLAVEGETSLAEIERFFVKPSVEV